MNFVVLSGGVGGAKFCHGMVRSVGAENLTTIVNVGDDLELYGLHISPDVDTVVYTLGNLANTNTGWGVTDDTWHNFETLQKLGGAPWFRLGDRDLAMHLGRTKHLRNGGNLTSATAQVCSALGIVTRILPVTDDRLRTMVETETGVLEFQDYFVRRRCEPAVRGLRFEGADEATPSGAVIASLEEADTIIIGPSNPYLSIDPMLSMQIVRDALFNASAPIIAVTPIIAGEAVKGPAAKMMRELKLEPSAVTVARHYGNFINGFVLDENDRALKPQIEDMGIGVMITDTLMRDDDERARLACEVVNFADALRPEKKGGCKLD